MLKSAGLVTTGLVAGALLTSGIIGHAIPSSTTHTITACVKSTGTTRLIDYQAGKRCVKGEKTVTWNQTGPRGLTGLKGVAGAAGSSGADGATGAAGPAGADGAVGPAGPAGPVGAEGPQGPQGATGPAGADGSQGVAGPVGATGAKGDTGPSDAYATSTFGASFSGSSSKQLVTTLTVPAGSYVFNADVTAENGVGGQYFACNLYSPDIGDFGNIVYSGAEPSGGFLSVHVTAAQTLPNTTVQVLCYFNGPPTLAWSANSVFNAIKVGALHTS
jgi:hypothetical protein